MSRAQKGSPKRSGVASVPISPIASVPLDKSYYNGPYAQTVDSLGMTTFESNAAFDELAWANARQNGRGFGCVDEAKFQAELPKWPPADPDQGWAHTYPQTSKHRTHLMGRCPPEDIENSPMSSMFLTSPVVTDANRAESYKIFRKFADTDVPRTDGTPEAREYDLALDIADKIAKSDALESTFYDMAVPLDRASGKQLNSYNERTDFAELNDAGKGCTKKHSERHTSRMTKRLRNLLTEDQSYGSTRKRLESLSDGAKQMASDVWNWRSDNAKHESLPNKLSRTFVQDGRWKYSAALFFVAVLVFVLVVQLFSSGK